MPNVIKMVRSCPEVRFVLDHIGKPGIKAGLTDPWRQHLKELAAMPNVHCKISGVVTEADHKNWTREQIKPYIAHAIETFRLRPHHVWRRLARAGACRHLSGNGSRSSTGSSEGATAEEKRKLFRDNAIGFYGLDKAA